MPGSRAPSDGRTQGAPIAVAMGATEDAPARRVLAGRAPVNVAGRVTVLVRVNRPALDRLHAEELLEHLQCGRRGRVTAVAAVLDQRANDEPRAVRRAVAAPPRLVEQAPVAVTRVDLLLGRAGLAGDRNREATKNRGRRSEWVVGCLVETVAHDLQRLRVDIRGLRRLRHARRQDDAGPAVRRRLLD